MNKEFIKIINTTMIFAVILFALITVMYFLHYDTITDHDTWDYAWATYKTASAPGRYLSVTINMFLGKILFEITNIHPNDIQNNLIAFIKSIIVVFICILITKSFFIFIQDKFKNINSTKFVLLFCITFLLIFLMLFNNFYFYNGIHQRVYMGVPETIVFIEYEFHIIFYFIYMMKIIYNYTYDKFYDNKFYILIIILTFLLGISAELINIPLLIFMTIFMLIMTIKTDLNNTFFKYMFLYIILLISSSIYYSNANDHFISWGANISLKQYFTTQFIPYLKDYLFCFIPESLLLSVIALIIAFTFYIFQRNKTEKDKRFIQIISISILSFYCFFLIMFIFGEPDEGIPFYIDMIKWKDFYRVISLFYLTITIGYIIDNKFKFDLSVKVKSLIIITILILLSKFLIFDYFKNMNEYRNMYKDIREIQYICEKYTRQNYKKGEKVIIYLPTKYEKSYNYLTENMYFPIFDWMYMYRVTKTKIRIPDNDIIIRFSDTNAVNNYTEEELKNIKFTSLLKDE